ncbi:MAG TPA: c-type cytochrome [Steroidobacteraceae bacterium]|jgi:cytochrome c oxidase cbb3-type subunit 3|nr:c-type cytochrome [Steroidobacteraceae bacterium]
MRPLRALALLSVASIGLCSCARQSAPSATTGVVPPAVRYQAHLAAGGTPPAGGTLTNPHAGDAAVAKQGALLFTTMNCDGCHGGDASGWVGPDLADGRWRYGGSDAEVFSTIYYGRPKGMPAFGGVLGTEGVWTLVTYIRSLPAPADVPTESWVGN